MRKLMISKPLISIKHSLINGTLIDKQKLVAVKAVGTLHPKRYLTLTV